MSSWLSLNPFKSDRVEEEPDEDPSNGGTGLGSVKEDLSDLKNTLTKQLWGVASFLAPPPPSSPSSQPPSSSSSQTLVGGIKNDFAEISGSFKSGFSLISGNKAVNQISKLASNILQFNDHNDQEEDDQSDESENYENEVVGVTQEVLEFVEEISLRPECWIDFPISLSDYDFDLSDVQKEHVSAVEHFSPSLVDLRMKLCPSHLREEHFWMIYFILLHPRLNKQDSEILSTSQIVEARDILLKTMQTRKNTHLETPKADAINENDINTNVVQEKEDLPKTESVEHQEYADVDQWLEEEEDVTGPGTSYTGPTHIGSEQDVSFSDLEDDDSDALSRQGRISTTEKPNESPQWVQLSENSDNGVSGRKNGSRGKDSEGEDSNEWLTIDEFDSDNNTGTAS